MVDDNTKLYNQRPPSDVELYYTKDVKNYIHDFHEDKLAILVCQIKIWEPIGDDWYTIPDDRLILRECESVEVTESAKELLGKAVVRFPRGTMVSVSSKKQSKVASGNADEGTYNESALKDATNDGDFISTESSVYLDDGLPITSMALNYDDKGLIKFNRTKKEAALLNPNDLAIGNRIEIRLGYAYSDLEYREMNSIVDHPDLYIAFTGFITSISASTPLEIECTNMAHVLACISTPNIPAKGALKVGDFLDPDGTYKLLEDTGITLAESSRKSEIFVTGGTISDNLTVADVLAAWNKSGICCFMDVDQKTGKAELKVGLTYYSGTSGTEMPNHDKKYITYKENNGDYDKVKFIQFDWDVAEDKLTLKNVDKKYLAVEAQGRTKANQFFKLTIRKNPDLDDDGWMVSEGEGDWQVVNEKELYNAKKAKEINGVKTNKRIKNKLKNKVSLDNYTVIPYFSPKVDITRQELIEEAKQYWSKHNPNGISGTISIFGDLPVKPTEIVGLIDIRFPEKNGYYFVEQVDTIFGVNGYRRELHMPFKVAKFDSVKVL